MFNSLKYAKNLEEVGFTREQAEAQMFIMMEVIETNLATKQDMKDLEGRLDHKMKDLESRLDHKMTDLENRLTSKFTNLQHQFEVLKDKDFKELEYRLTIKLGTMMSIAIGIAVALTKLIS